MIETTGEFVTQGMSLIEWREICRQSGLPEPQKIPTEAGDIYLCEAFYGARMEYQKPHMMTVWAVGRDEFMIMARQHYHDFKEGMMSKDERLAEAERDAREFLGERAN